MKIDGSVDLLISGSVPNSLVIPAVAIEMGGIDGVRLGVWSKTLSH